MKAEPPDQQQAQIPQEMYEEGDSQMSGNMEQYAYEGK